MDYIQSALNFVAVREVDCKPAYTFFSMGGAWECRSTFSSWDCIVTGWLYQYPTQTMKFDEFFCCVAFRPQAM